MDDDARRAQRVREIDALRDEITQLAGHLNAANYRFLKLVAEFDRRAGWVDHATHSCAHWLNWKCGIAMGAAREKVRVARALESLPKISAAMERGEISYSKVREMTRVACAATEEALVMIARHGTAAHVEKMVRGFRRAKNAEEMQREAVQQAERSVSWHYDADGSLLLRAKLPAEIGAIVLKAMELAIEEIPLEQVSQSRADVPAGTPTVKSIPSARRADALALLAESFLEHGVAATTGGERNQIIVHVAEETLRNHAAGCCEFEQGPAIAAETARRLACDASIITLIESENGDPLNLGRKTRTISTPLRRFLRARDKGCRFPGCANTHHIDAHHIQHWANGGNTKPSNLVSLCSFHHRKVHEGGMRIEVLDDGALRFIKPDGTMIDSTAQGCTQPLSDWTQIYREHGELEIHINEKTAATKWLGERCDYGLGVEVLLAQAKRGRSVGAFQRER
ncbi:MAG TPA: DUF222 domain-containing protein [Steroidobacteraceae bacterium]|nr:DUF222 domain-containing protein [Steroidobacteraceae bacterium]